MNCECGCGKIVNSGKRFILGHNAKMKEGRQRMSSLGSLSKDVPRPSEVRTKISNSTKGRLGVKGRKSWNKGLTKETDKRVKRNGEHRKHPNKVTGWSKGLTKETDDRVFRISKGVKRTHKHQKPWLGKKRNESFKEKSSKSHKLWWCNPDNARKQFEAYGVLPNKTEIYIDTLVQTARPTDFIYSGDGKIWIAGKCPDWFNVNGRKQVIEYFSNYWHGEKRTGRTKEEEEQQRIDHFAKYGYKTLIIWEPELKEPDQVIDKIKKF